MGIINRAGKTAAAIVLSGALIAGSAYGEIVDSIDDRINLDNFIIDAGNNSTLVSVPGGAPSDWAAEIIAQAINRGVVPVFLMTNYKRPITRGEYCALMVAGYENENGPIAVDFDIADYFVDTLDEDVAKAVAIGVARGRGDGIFDPDGTITREEAATMNYRAFEALGGRSLEGGVNFADKDQISAYAQEAVNRMTAIGVINGVGNNSFNPQGTYTIEQAIVSLERMLIYLERQLNQARQTRDIEKLRREINAEGLRPVMLTFDDGPSRLTMVPFLDYLSAKDVRVTFCWRGDLMKQNPYLVIEAYRQGHTVAGHTMNHRNLTKISYEEVRQEIVGTNQILKDILGIESTMFRPPFGYYDERTIEIVQELGMNMLLWDADTNDWHHRDADIIYDEFTKLVYSGTIVLAHDAIPETIVAAMKLIDELLVGGDVAFISYEEAVALGYIDITKNVIYDMDISTFRLNRVGDCF
jgi:peptidoglycan/xylan/chitin deacetylase (PgdA/CDA1 family)